MSQWNDVYYSSNNVDEIVDSNLELRVSTLEAQMAGYEPLAVVDWSDILNKPTEFMPTDHEHSWDSITGKPVAYLPTEHHHSWASIPDKPVSFEPVPHTHQWGSIIDVPISFPPSAHTHDWISIENKPLYFHPDIHGHSWYDITDVPTEFNPTHHLHAWSSLYDIPLTFPPSYHDHPDLRNMIELNSSKLNEFNNQLDDIIEEIEKEDWGGAAGGVLNVAWKGLMAFILFKALTGGGPKPPDIDLSVTHEDFDKRYVRYTSDKDERTISDDYTLNNIIVKDVSVQGMFTIQNNSDDVLNFDSVQGRLTVTGTIWGTGMYASSFTGVQFMAGSQGDNMTLLNSNGVEIQSVSLLTNESSTLKISTSDGLIMSSESQGTDEFGDVTLNVNNVVINYDGLTFKTEEQNPIDQSLYTVQETTYGKNNISYTAENAMVTQIGLEGFKSTRPDTPNDILTDNHVVSIDSDKLEISYSMDKTLITPSFIKCIKPSEVVEGLSSSFLSGSDLKFKRDEHDAVMLTNTNLEFFTPDDESTVIAWNLLSIARRIPVMLNGEEVTGINSTTIASNLIWVNNQELGSSFSVNYNDSMNDSGHLIPVVQSTNNLFFIETDPTMNSSLVGQPTLTIGSTMDCLTHIEAGSDATILMESGRTTKVELNSRFITVGNNPYDSECSFDLRIQNDDGTGMAGVKAESSIVLSTASSSAHGGLPRLEIGCKSKPHVILASYSETNPDDLTKPFRNHVGVGTYTPVHPVDIVGVCRSSDSFKLESTATQGYMEEGVDWVYNTETGEFESVPNPDEDEYVEGSDKRVGLDIVVKDRDSDGNLLSTDAGRASIKIDTHTKVELNLPFAPLEICCENGDSDVIMAGNGVNKVGIGMYDPTYTLDVRGGGRFRDTLGGKTLVMDGTYISAYKTFRVVEPSNNITKFEVSGLKTVIKNNIISLKSIDNKQKINIDGSGTYISDPLTVVSSTDTTVLYADDNGVALNGIVTVNGQPLDVFDGQPLDVFDGLLNVSADSFVTLDPFMDGLYETIHDDVSHIVTDSHIIPSMGNISNLGSRDRPFKAVYAEHIYAGKNSLYIGAEPGTSNARLTVDPINGEDGDPGVKLVKAGPSNIDTYEDLAVGVMNCKNRLITHNGVLVTKSIPGPLIEIRSNPIHRFGVGAYTDTTRLYASSEGSGHTVRMGFSTSDTTFNDVMIIRQESPIDISKTFRVTTTDPGPLIERMYSPTDRYGIAHYTNRMDVYAGSPASAQVSLGFSETDGTTISRRLVIDKNNGGTMSFNNSSGVNLMTVSNLNPYTVSIKSGISVTDQDPGPLIERMYSPTDRYGIAHYTNRMDVYAGSPASATVCLGFANSLGDIDRRLTVSKNSGGTLTIKGNETWDIARFGYNLPGSVSIEIRKGIKLIDNAPGVLIEKSYSDMTGDRYGIGHWGDQATRLYAGTHDISSIRIGYVDGNMVWDDRLMIDKSNGGNMTFRDNLGRHSFRISTSGGAIIGNDGLKTLHLIGTETYSTFVMSSKPNTDLFGITATADNTTILTHGRPLYLDNQISFIQPDPPMLEKRYGTNLGDRYGVRQDVGGTMRMYASDTHGPATVNMSFAKTDGSFKDVVTVYKDAVTLTPSLAVSETNGVTIHNGLTVYGQVVSPQGFVSGRTTLTAHSIEPHLIIQRSQLQAGLYHVFHYMTQMHPSSSDGTGIFAQYILAYRADGASLVIRDMYVNYGSNMSAVHIPALGGSGNNAIVYNDPLQYTMIGSSHVFTWTKVA